MRVVTVLHRTRIPPDGNEPRAGNGEYAYLANSHLVATTTFKPNGALKLTTTQSYDGINRLTHIQSTTSATTVTPHAYTYNAANQRIKATREDGSYWNYSYDVLGQVATV